MSARRPGLRGLLAAIFAACAFAWAAGVHAEGADPAAPAPEAHVGTELVLRALSLLGVNYKLGGNTPDTGLDCSGLVRHVFREAVGLVLPRRAAEISRTGEVIVDTAQLKPGDLVFFNTLRRAFSHVGIYIGNNQFVHAPSSGGVVRVESLEARYWVDRFDGARRVLPGDEELPIVSGALDRLLGSLNPEPVAGDGFLRTSVPATRMLPEPSRLQPRAAAGRPMARHRTAGHPKAKTPAQRRR